MPFICLAEAADIPYNAAVMAVDIQKYTGGPVACNAYLLRAEQGAYVAVDAPLGFADWVLKRLPEGARLTDLLLTHQHFDHVQDAARLQEATQCRIHAHSPYSDALTLAAAARAWGIEPPAPFVVDGVLGDATPRADWGGLAWQLHAIPGHAPDGMAYGLPAEPCVFVGDILFAGSIGRTDFPGGSHAALVRGIREKLLALDPATAVYSGHGPDTSLQEEMLNNPYIC